MSSHSFRAAQGFLQNSLGCLISDRNASQVRRAEGQIRGRAVGRTAGGEARSIEEPAAERLSIGRNCEVWTSTDEVDQHASGRLRMNQGNCVSGRVSTFNVDHPPGRVMERSDSFPDRSVRRSPQHSWIRERKQIFSKGKTKKAKKIRLSMWEHEFICLASCGQEEPPTPFEKADLIRAGLGPKKLSFFEDGSSSEFKYEMLSAFPKLKDGGGYELLRTATRNNKILRVIPHPPGGYTAEYVKNVVCQAKVYVRPIQQDLSAEPVAEDEDEYVETETEVCMYCHQEVGIKVLREHVRVCQTISLSFKPGGPSSVSPDLVHCGGGFGAGGSSQSPDSELFGGGGSNSEGAAGSFQDYQSPDAVHHVSDDADDKDHDVELIGIENEFLEKAIEDSKSQSCHMLYIKAATSDKRSIFMSCRNPETLQDVILILQKECGIVIPDSPEDWIDCPRTYIDVRRDKVVEDGIREARKKRFDPSRLLNVDFVPEHGVDTGGPRREFFRLFAQQAVDVYCVGDPGKCLFMKNVPALQSEDFRIIGKVISTSIIQGGPGFPVMLPAAYNYIVSGKYLGEVLDDSDVPDPFVRQLLKMVDDAATNDELRAVFDDDTNGSMILETGFRKALSSLVVADKQSLRTALRDHHTLIKIKPELDQFIDGLNEVGILEMVKKYPTLMSQLFTRRNPKTIDKKYFKSLFTLHFSEYDPVKKQKEETAFIYFLDFIEGCEDGTIRTDDNKSVQPQDILVFFTGSDMEPPLGFSPQPQLAFVDDVLASASTCALKLYLPLNHQTYDSFKSYMILSLLGNDGFGRA